MRRPSPAGRPRRRGSPSAEAKLAALFTRALEVARDVGGATLARLTAGGTRDAAYYGAWLANSAMTFERLRKR